ncbi:hypothetical protein Pcinc_001748 [Petrolisthes cinctipes]|uniref:Uncharacterized protein n=1 Tax=Petrolisthes cinctipes TaxID=88211 RepID=A0AAE1GL06_PETCI|nr:hypothetical protein Pcinc_001748 [Petrolisthes cinctipes]
MAAPIFPLLLFCRHTCPHLISAFVNPREAPALIRSQTASRFPLLPQRHTRPLLCSRLCQPQRAACTKPLLDLIRLRENFTTCTYGERGTAEVSRRKELVTVPLLDGGVLVSVIVVHLNWNPTGRSGRGSVNWLFRLYATFDVSSGPCSYSSLHHVTNVALHSTPHLLHLYATFDDSSGMCILLYTKGYVAHTPYYRHHRRATYAAASA